MEIFIREEENRYIVFFAHETIGHIRKESLTNQESLQNVLRCIAYNYCHKINQTGPYGPKKTYATKQTKRVKDQGILKDILDVFW